MRKLVSAVDTHCGLINPRLAMVAIILAVVDLAGVALRWGPVQATPPGGATIGQAAIDRCSLAAPPPVVPDPDDLAGRD